MKLIHCFPILLLLIISFSCRENTNEYIETIDIKGKITNEFTGKPIPNYGFKLEEKRYSGSIPLASVTIENSVTTKTDDDGNFNFSFGIKHKDDEFKFTGFETENYTEFAGNTTFNYQELTRFQTFKVRNWENLEITLKNANPFDEEDAVRIFIFEQPSGGMYITKIINYGIANQPYPPPMFNDGLNPYWIGKNVNSVIFAKLQNGTKYQISYTVTKNKVTTQNSTLLVQTVSGVTNKVSINY